MISSRPRWRKKRYRCAIALALVAAFAFLNNTQLLVAGGGEPPKLLAHRGVAQTFGAGTTCRGVGLMPSLDEVLAEFPREPLLLHIKSDDPAEGEALARRLSELDGQRLANIAVYGGDAPLADLRERLPQIRTSSKAGTRVVLVAGSGGFSEGFDTPESFGRIPDDYAGFVWTNRIADIAPLVHR